ncbi:MAG: hypothetical protein JXC85_02170 [Candidatus Aenigmarchaeota archaeon]|nr:hypothetical protein [Candidatus Aenigmarchaeota archaeon]
MTTHSLCSRNSCCPVVDIGESGVRIGEEGNSVALDRTEWDMLVKKIRSGEIK